MTALGIRDRALEVQKAIYSIGASLLPPRLDDLPPAATDPYQPFESIQEIEINWVGERIVVSPLVMLDDVHALHPDQFKQIFAALARREIKFGRWMMMRLDALSPGAIFRSADSLGTHNLKADRDFIDIFMQGHGDRNAERRQFRAIATDMADRYLPLMQALQNRGPLPFARLVPTEPPRLTDARMRELAASVDRIQHRLNITPPRRARIEQLVATYLAGTNSGDKLARVNSGVGFVIDRLIEPHPIFHLIQHYSHALDHEMFEVFNMGIGFCYVVAPDLADEVLSILQRHGREAQRIGYAIADKSKTVHILERELEGQHKTFRSTGKSIRMIAR